MHISKIFIENFRLLENVELCLEDRSTVITGRNNSGKTSITELFRCLLDEGTPHFKLEDFSLGVHEQFWSAFDLHKNDAEENAIREALPEITVELIVNYEDSSENFGPLTNFIIDLNEECTSAKVNIRYALEAGKIPVFFSDLENDRLAFFKTLKERIPKYFKATVEAEDPNDPGNRKALDYSTLRSLLQFGFINAQRALDDATHTDKAVLGRIFEALFIAAASDAANQTEKDKADVLRNAVIGVQDEIDTNFNEQLTSLIPAFNLFGYLGLSDPQLVTETVLKVEKLLSNHTTIRYKGFNGVNLPESYNGLGPRNLIFILLKLFEFFREFTVKQPTSSIYLVFIEEPEAHLHPQMQNVFIRKLDDIAILFATQFNEGNPWPVQFVVTTHSSHIANEANFNTMRYFLSQPREAGSLILNTEIKDLRAGLSNEAEEDREFLHKYMTLTRCDLLFVDRAILIEGATERLLLPEMIKKSDNNAPDGSPMLGSQYLTIMEVGGAYAHKFFNLLNFLNLRYLIITDLDTINEERKKCKVSEGVSTSNACINNWFSGEGDEASTKDEILVKTETDKIRNNSRLAYQIPHTDGDACGRSLEDAFMLANIGLFEITGTTNEERENQAWTKATNVNKTDFAMKYAIQITEWTIPNYIEEGLRWLAESPTVVTELTENITAPEA